MNKMDGQKKTTIQHPGKGAPSPHTVFIRGKDIHIKGITVMGGLDRPNQTAQENGGVGIRCTTGGFVDGPLGTLGGKQGAKAIEHGCVDRVEPHCRVTGVPGGPLGSSVIPHSSG